MKIESRLNMIYTLADHPHETSQRIRTLINEELIERRNHEYDIKNAEALTQEYRLRLYAQRTQSLWAHLVQWWEYKAFWQRLKTALAVEKEKWRKRPTLYEDNDWDQEWDDY